MPHARDAQQVKANGSPLKTCGKWQQSNIARLLDGCRKTALMRGANPGQAARHNLAALGNKLREQPHVFVINGVNFFHAKLANLLAPEKFAATFASCAARAGAGASRARPIAVNWPRRFRPGFPGGWGCSSGLFLVSHNTCISSSNLFFCAV